MPADVIDAAVDELLSSVPDDRIEQRGRLFDLGLAWVHLPKGRGGSARQLSLRTRANSIEGGTTEIQRNIVGERVLGLPPEPRADKDGPWKDVPR